ncbi:MAG: M20/M25/M40 family metallo-hydrolase [Candidatus Acidiferrales bacterium]
MGRTRTALASLVYGGCFAVSITCASALATICASALATAAQGGAAGSGNAAAAAAAKAREYHRANQHKIVNELREWLSIPNVAADTANIQRAGERLKQMLEQRGVRARLLPIAGRGPVVYGELPAPGAKRTVIFYCHYDGQPVDASRWIDTKPFEPALRTAAIHAGGKLIPFPEAGTPYQDDWRIYARSASDDKSPIIALLTALDILRANKIPLAFNLKFAFDGEEEDGSPNLEKTLLAHKELFAADLLISADGPVHQTGLPELVFGNRGVMDVEITVYGPYRALHSGHYGNWAPNPAMRLAELLATMKEEEGRVLIAGFYDDVVPLTALEKSAIADAPKNEPELMREFGFAQADGGGKSLLELIHQPSLNVRGLRSAYVGGEARTIVPDSAIASLDLRLVKNIDPKTHFEKVVAHIRKQGFYVTDREPTAEERAKYPRIARVEMGGGYRAARMQMDHLAAQALVRVSKAAIPGPWVMLPTSGGSVPMYIFENLGLPVAHVPIVNHDNNQHSENENLRLGNFWRGIELFTAIFAGLTW